MNISFSTLTNIGKKREKNEDNFLIMEIDPNKRKYLDNELMEIDLEKKGIIFTVCDGVGGENAGEIASKITVNTLENYFESGNIEIEENQIKNIFDKIILKAHKNIINEASNNRNYFNMASTINLNLIYNNKLFIEWCGDSRTYLFRDNLGLLTTDHSYVYQWYKQGILTKEEMKDHPMRNVITQCLGIINNPPKPEFVFYNLYPGDRILICTDGLNNMVDDLTIESILRSKEPTSKTSQILVDEANNNGGIDNITLILCDIW